MPPDSGAFRGSLKLTVTSMGLTATPEVQLTGIGELYAKFEALKEQFRLEGLFEPQRKRQIPQYPRRVALISAAGSKASEDFLQTMRAEAPFVHVEFLSSRVQGDGAQVDIREAFDRAEKLDVDVIVLTRGGGSYEDLFTFNEEVVVRAIARSRHPVITAIGHQEDHPHRRFHQAVRGAAG